MFREEERLWLSEKKEIPYWWRKICPESGHKLSLDYGVVTLFQLLFTNDRQKATKVECKRDESITKQSIFVEYILLLKKHWVLLELIRSWTQHFTRIDQEKPKM